MIEQQKECLKSSTMKGQFVWWIQKLKGNQLLALYGEEFVNLFKTVF